jgi:putative transposase
MPSRNERKLYVAGGLYHVYNRGHSKQHIFLDDKDYKVFLNLCKRYLAKDLQVDEKGKPYKNYYAELHLRAFCLMPNHFHMLVEQESASVMSEVLQRILVSYSAHFNKRYEKIGSVFQGRYKAVLVDEQEYLPRVLDYIHQNPKDIVDSWQAYPYSSIKAYLGEWQASWLKVLKL